MSYLEELLPEFRKGAKIRQSYRGKDYFIQLKDGVILDSYGSQYKFTPIDILEDKWELYQEPIDWDYIIKNKCLCWFWDEYENCKVKGMLAEIENDNEYPFRIDLYNSHYRHCRPVRRDEVSFYEDKIND